MMRYKVKDGCRVKVDGVVYTEGQTIEFEIDENEVAEVEALKEFLAPKMRKLEPLDGAAIPSPGVYQTREMRASSPKGQFDSSIELDDLEQFED